MTQNIVKFNLRIEKDLYDKIALAAQVDNLSINQFMLEAVTRYTAFRMNSLEFKKALQEKIAKEQAILDGAA